MRVSQHTKHCPCWWDTYCAVNQVDSEMNILRGERDQAKDIIDDLQKKLAAVNAVLADHDAERQVGSCCSS